MLDCADVLLLRCLQDTGPYKDVKYMSDTEMGIPSQCFVAKPAGIGYGNAPRGLPQVRRCSYFMLLLLSRCVC